MAKPAAFIQITKEKQNKKKKKNVYSRERLYTRGSPLCFGSASKMENCETNKLHGKSVSEIYLYLMGSSRWCESVHVPLRLLILLMTTFILTRLIDRQRHRSNE